MFGTQSKERISKVQWFIPNSVGHWDIGDVQNLWRLSLSSKISI